MGNRETDLHRTECDRHLSMQVVAFTALDELAPYAEDWDRLAAGVPMRSWAWMSSWWQSYCADRADGFKLRLAVLGVFDSTDRLVGIAPWHLRRTGSQGRVLRWLGSGEVCSDYPSILCQPSMEDRVAEATAEYLAGPAGCRERDFAWDLLDLCAVDAQDQPTLRLVEHLADRGCLVHRQSGMNCWRLELPSRWDEYLARLSKSHRKQVRRLEREYFESGRAVLHTVQRRGELPQAMDLLVDLHQQRRQSVGQRGCFASQRYSAFLREVTPRLLANGQLQLHWLEIDGRPAAVEHHLAGEGIAYAYQAGIDPQTLPWQPGRLITLAIIRRAIEQGGRAVDFLRGDEPYKAHFRASPSPSLSLRIVPNRATSRMWHGLWLAGKRVKGWMK